MPCCPVGMAHVRCAGPDQRQLRWRNVDLERVDQARTLLINTRQISCETTSFAPAGFLGVAHGH